MKMPFAISLPHCADEIPMELRPAVALSDAKIRASVDIGTKEIFGSLPVEAVLLARWSRLVVDLNRGPDERGPKGVIAAVDYQGRAVFHRASFPEEQEISRRIKRYHRPYHKRLAQALKNQDIKILFDCHSMHAKGPVQAPDKGEKRKHIILGNNGNPRGFPVASGGETTCTREILFSVKEAFESQGFSVSINYPYMGGYITKQYGRGLVHEGRAAIQIEINQELFLVGETTQPAPESLADVRVRIRDVFESIERGVLQI
jgi:N-formylglutamate amidohydrolase